MSSDSELIAYLLKNEPSFRKARLAALYSDFSSLRTINPDGYSANIEAWRNAFAHAALAGVLPSQDCLVLTLDESLLRDLETKEWGKPLALGTVIAESTFKKEMMLLKDFTDAKDSIYSKSWVIPRPWDILGWGLKQLGFSGGSGKVVNAKVVLLSNLEDAAKEFAAKTAGQRSRVERIYSCRAFSEQFRDTLSTKKGLSDADLDVFIRYLQRDKGLLSWDGDTVKLKAPGENMPSAITHEDCTIASLKTLIQDLEIQTKLLESKVDELNATARKGVEKKNRVAALAALRSKKLAETTLGKRHATLAQLEEVFMKIEQAAGQVELVRIMESSAKALAGLNKEVGGVERVDNIVDQLRNQMSQVDEVGNVIAEAGNNSGLDEEEVDDELEAMEREARRKIEEVERNKREEAEETRQRLATLGEAGRQAEVKEAEDKANDIEKAVEETEEVLKLMSLDTPENVPA